MPDEDYSNFMLKAVRLLWHVEQRKRKENLRGFPHPRRSPCRAIFMQSSVFAPDKACRSSHANLVTLAGKK